MGPAGVRWNEPVLRGLPLGDAEEMVSVGRQRLDKFARRDRKGIQEWGTWSLLLGRSWFQAGEEEDEEDKDGG